MTIRDTFGIENQEAIAAQKTETPKPNRGDIIQGEIYHLGDGYGFIESDAIPYSRIFFHWQNLVHGSVHFTELKRGALMEFAVIEERNTKTGIMEWRAQKVRMVKNG
jgi:hypothetical protein